MPLPLPQRGALRVRDDHGPSARDVQPSRVFPLRDVLRLPCGVGPRVHDAVLLYDDSLLLSLT